MRPFLLCPSGRAIVVLLSLAAATPWGCGGPADSTAPEESAVTVRSWRGSIKRHRLRSPRRVHLVVDYGDGSVTEQSRKPNQWRQDRPAPRPPAPSSDELAAAFALATDQPEVAKLRRQGSLELAGGYLVSGSDGPHSGSCPKASRCVEIFALRPGNPQPAAGIVVDLISRRVVVESFEATE